MTLDPSLAAFVKDPRSPLARALGERGVVVKAIDDAGGGLDGIPLALRIVTDAQRSRGVGAALKYLMEVCGLPEPYLYDTDAGRAEVDLECKIQMLAVALCEQAPPHDAVVKDADDLRALLSADEVLVLFERYVAFVEERSPLTRAKSAQEVESIVDALGKGTTPLSRLSSFDASTLRRVALSLASRLMSSTSFNSSPSPPSTKPGTTP
jgi:hypothetical protein